MKKIVFMMLAASVLVFTGCTKVGPPGPQGPQGPAGYDGNANVIGSDPFTVSSWSYDGTLKAYTATFSSPDITPDIVDYGSVSIFKEYNTNVWTNLPDLNDGAATVYDFYDGGFTIYVQNLDGSAPAFPGTVTFRTVVISSSLRDANPNTDWTNYKEVMQAIGQKTDDASPATF